MTVEKTYIGDRRYPMTEKQIKKMFVDYGEVKKIEYDGEVNVNITVEYASEEKEKKVLRSPKEKISGIEMEILSGSGIRKNIRLRKGADR